jgi:hypothetical protein
MRAVAISDILDGMASRSFGRSLTEAHRLSCCVRCGQKVRPDGMEPVDRNEYLLSGFCPECYQWLEDSVDGLA